MQGTHGKLWKRRESSQLFWLTRERSPTAKPMLRCAQKTRHRANKHRPFQRGAKTFCV